MYELPISFLEQFDFLWPGMVGVTEVLLVGLVNASFHTFHGDKLIRATSVADTEQTFRKKMYFFSLLSNT